MNFLAHSYLSGNRTKLRIGNFIGDFVKGKDFQNYESEISEGILLHREIDQFTDSHHIVSQSKKRLNGKYGHYAGVIVDIFYDHFLAVEWLNYHSSPLLTYTQEVYNDLENHKDKLPQRFNHMLSYMVPQNWLFHYSNIDGIRQSLGGLARRTKFDSKMEFATDDLELDYSSFQEDFRQFFPDICSFVEQYLETKSNPN